MFAELIFSLPGHRYLRKGGDFFLLFILIFLEDEASVLPQVVFFLLFLTDKDEIILLKLANRFHEKIRVLFASNIFVIFTLP